MKKRNTELAAGTAVTADSLEPELGPVEHSVPVKETSAPPSANSPPASEAEPPAPAAVPSPLPSALTHDDAADRPDASEKAPLEHRIRRLEDVLAQLQESRPRTPSPIPLPAPIPVARPAALPPTARVVPPAATSADSTAALVMAGAHLLAGTTPQASTQRNLWLLFDIVAEARAISRMFVDPRYKMSWLGRIAPLVLLFAFFTTYYWAPGTVLPGGLGWAINKVWDLLVGYFLFRVLCYEARRYRQTAPDLPPTLRL